MGEFIGLTIAGLALGAIYAIGASGLVVTYTTSGVFNFAHGAIGMVVAFAYWQLRVADNLNAPLSLGLALLVIAPGIGLIIDSALIRRLNVNDTGRTLVVTLAVMVALMGVAFVLWPETVGRNLPLFFGPSANFSIGGELISYEEVIAIGLAVATAVGLRLFLYNTRLGISMRGAVDDRSLMAMNGRSPALLSALSWMIGASLGGLAGILTASLYSLDILNLTLLVLNSFAAAMLGRLKNLILTFVGALILGLADAYVTGYFSLTGWLAHLNPVLPTLFLFMVILLLPAVRLRAGLTSVSKSIPIATAWGSLRNGAFLVIAAIVIGPFLHGTVLGNVNEGVAVGIGALSIVLLSGFGGQISLAQYTFFGLGAWIFAETAHGGGLLALLLATGAGAALGAAVALPALRLRGLELALWTLAFGQLAYYMFFLQPQVMGRADLIIPRLHLPGISLKGDDANLVFLTAVFAALSAGIWALRRSRFGRILVASKDSQAAVSTLGLNLPLLRVLLFAFATAIATFGGALYGSTQQVVTSDDFQYIASLFIVLIVYVYGISTPGAALAGGLSLGISPLISLHIPVRYQAVTYFMTGFGALGLLKQPEGILPALSERLRGALPRRFRSRTSQNIPIPGPDLVCPTLEISHAVSNDI